MINGHTAEQAIKAIQNWAMLEGNEDFDTSFVESVAEGMEKFGEPTERQASAIENIITRFEIDIAKHS